MNEDAIVRRPHQVDPNGARYLFLAAKSHVKEVKVALEKVARFDRYHGIAPHHSVEQRMRIPTTISPLAAESDQQTIARLLTELNLAHLSQDITLSSWTPPTTNHRLDAETNPLRRALKEALQTLAPETIRPPNLTIDDLVATFPESYSVYKPLLLLPSTSPNSPWPTLISNHASSLEPVWSHIAAAFSCTHIALNSPIPASNTPSSAHAHDAANILRSPVNLTPVHGDFGPPPTRQTLSHPTQHDFQRALWVHSTQNGIRQTWAPQYTMFSRGNVKEKARIQRLSAESVAAAGEAGVSAVDMYAGIGYFAFSYKSGGMGRVLCWELNPWSVEGLRRGAALNRWRVRVFTTSLVPAPSAPLAEWDAWSEGVVRAGDELLVFAMSNENADCISYHLRSRIAPIRHVNLGLLPVSRLTWPSAVRAVDATCGGWVHAHENVGVVDMDERRDEVEAEFQRLAVECGDGGETTRQIKVEHVERVKMYAPGVVHVVFDVAIPGIQIDS